MVRSDKISDRWKYLDIISHDEGYYYINKKLIKFNWKVDFFNSLYRHTLYSARTWVEEKWNQLAYRLQWIIFEHARILLQQEGYVLLSDINWIDWFTMLK